MLDSLPDVAIDDLVDVMTETFLEGWFPMCRLAAQRMARQDQALADRYQPPAESYSFEEGDRVWMK